MLVNVTDEEAHKEHELLEKLNQETNERLAKRPVTNFITCPECKGRGTKSDDMFNYPYELVGYDHINGCAQTILRKCKQCEGTGYVNNTIKS